MAPLTVNKGMALHRLQDYLVREVDGNGSLNILVENILPPQIMHL